MALNPSLEQQTVLADTLREAESPLPRHDRILEGLLALGFVAAAVLLWLAAPPDGGNFVTATLCVLVLMAATEVSFDTALGYTAATQLAFVPLLFGVPLAFVPVAVLTALMVPAIAFVLSGRARPRRLLLTFGNACFCLGPVAVFALAGIAPRHAGPGLLVVALAAQFLVDFTVSTIRFWIGREADFSLQVRETWVYIIDAGLSGIALAVAAEIPHTPIAALAPLPMLGLLAVFARERHDRIESLLELNTAYRGTALVLGDFVEADDDYTGEHCRGVVRLALAVGTEIGLDAEQLRNLEFSALLHDVGKIAIPKEIINKPGKLEPAEWEIIQTHTVEGQRMLDRIGGFMRHVGLIVRSHHERWDGTGYPDALAGEAIPLEARIISCCDTWNAMRTDRAYRRALSHEVAVAELTASAGTQLDPAVVAILLRLVNDADELPVAARAAGRLHPATVSGWG